MILSKSCLKSVLQHLCRAKMGKAIVFFLLFTQVPFAYAQEVYTNYDDAVFLVDEVIKVGEENFLNRIGLKENPNPTITDQKYVPINEDQEDLPVGLVLSGGAARAFAHIGVLKSLEKEGVYPDFLVVNSMGSIVALLYAAGFSPDQIEKIVSDYPMDFLFTARFPLDGGLIDDANMISAIRAILGEKDIKDLEIPIVVFAEDLLSRRTVAFMEGDFYKILSATIAMPIAFPPVRYDDMILIDGGTTNLVPVQAASEYTDRIITSASFSNPTGEYRDLISVISRSLDLAKTRKGIEEIKAIDNILIRCDVEDISYMAFDKAQEIAQRGEESADLVIHEIKAKGFQNDTTWTDERMQGLTEKRNELSNKHDEVLLGYKNTNMLPQKEFSGYVSGGFQMYSSAEDDYYLDNSDYFYLSQYGAIGNTIGEVREYWDPWRGVGVDTRLNFSFFNFITLENRAAFKWDSLFNNGFIDGFEGIYYYGKLEASITKDGSFGVDPFFAFETFIPNTNGLNLALFSYFTRLGTDVYFGNFSITPYAFFETESVFGLGIENDFKINFTDSFFLRQKTVSRMHVGIFPYDNRTAVTLYKNDGARSTLTEGEFDYIIITNNNLTYNIETVGTLFDSVSIKNLELTAFCDYYKTDVHGVSVGGELGIEIAAVGLVSFNLSGYGGYDIMHNGGFWGFSIGGKL